MHRCPVSEPATSQSRTAVLVAHAMHVLAHQVMAPILQEGGLSRHRLLPWVEMACSFGIRCLNRGLDVVCVPATAEQRQPGGRLLRKTHGRGKRERQSVEQSFCARHGLSSIGI
jgi:hypothetical protein